MERHSWEPQWQALCEKWDARGYEALSSEEKVWVNVRSLIDSIENGGLISYYYNSGADHLDDCLVALDRLHAEEVRQQVERVNALFGERVPKTVDERNAVIDSWDELGDGIDELLEEVDDLLMPMMPNLEVKLDGFLRSVGLAT
jgi:hypothetical protein